MELQITINLDSADIRPGESIGLCRLLNAISHDVGTDEWFGWWNDVERDCGRRYRDLNGNTICKVRMVDYDA